MASVTSCEGRVIEIGTQARNCDLCGGNDFSTAWEYQYLSRARSHTFRWKVRIVVCINCGFAFVSPSPDSNCLTEYYKEAYLLPNEHIDYSVESRLKVIRRNAASLRTFVEIGSNATTAFSETISQMFDEYHRIDLNSEATTTSNTTAAINSGVADVVASYFVLEHVTDVHGFLSECARLVRPGGSVILEVPDLNVYPRDPIALLLHEHVNHFSPATLASIAERQGLHLVEVSHSDCSRTYGFVAVFRLNAEDRRSVTLPGVAEGENAIKCIKQGLNLIEEFNARLEAARRMLRNKSFHGQKSVLWAANDVCSRLLGLDKPPDGVVVVDTNPNKRNYLPTTTAYQPAEVIDHIRAASTVVICSSFYAEDISKQIEAMAGSNTQRSVLVLRLS